MATSKYKKVIGAVNRAKLAEQVLYHGVEITFKGGSQSSAKMVFNALPAKGDSISVGDLIAVFRKKKAHEK